MIAKIALALVLVCVICYGVFGIVDYMNRNTGIRLTDEGFEHAAVFDGCAVLNGIDVSVHQGEEINWRKVKTSGTDFVFMRAGYRSADEGILNEDSTFKENMAGAERAGMMVGAYFYSQALTPEEAVEEADYLLELVQPYDVTLPLVIDYEIFPDGRLDQKIQAGEMYAASFYHDIVLAFCRRIEAAGYEAAVYANKDMLTHYMQADLLDDDATIWLAQYGNTSDLDADYWFWQASDSAEVGGIDANVDHDFWYIRPDKVYKTRGSSKVREKNRISIGDCRVSFQRSVTKLKRGQAIPKLGVTCEGRHMREGSDYVISYVRNTEAGTGYIILRGIGKYKNWIMLPFEIE